MVITDYGAGNKEVFKDDKIKINGGGAVIKDEPKKSMHEQYLNSKGIQVFNDDILYFSYQVAQAIDIHLDFIIEAFYLEEQHRMNIRPQFQKVFNHVKNNYPECKYMVATVIPKVKGSENMLRCLLKMGFYLEKANDNIITLRYLIPEKEHDKYK